MVVSVTISIIVISSVYSIGSGAVHKLETIMKNFGFGADAIIIISGPPISKHFNVKQLSLTDQDLDDIKMVNGVSETSAGIFFKEYSLKYKGNTILTGVQGGQSNWAKVRHWGVSQGRFFDRNDVIKRLKVCVIGATVAKQLFNTKSVLGRFININNHYFKIIGVLSRKGAVGKFDVDNIAIIPYTTFRALLYHTRYFAYIKVNIEQGSNMNSVIKTITYILRKNHNLHKGRISDFKIIKPSQIIEMVTKANYALTMFLIIIAGISMIVSGIVIMNMMLSYIEKKKYEIAVKRSFGATRKDIIKEITLTGSIIGLISAIVGLVITFSISLSIGGLLPFDMYVCPRVVLFSTFFSLLTGFLFSLVPAYRASKMQPSRILL